MLEVWGFPLTRIELQNKGEIGSAFLGIFL